VDGGALDACHPADGQEGNVVDADTGAAGDEAVPKFVQEHAGEEAADKEQAEEYATGSRARLHAPNIREPEYDKRKRGVDANVDPRDAREPECAHAALFRYAIVSHADDPATGLHRGANSTTARTFTPGASRPARSGAEVLQRLDKIGALDEVKEGEEEQEVGEGEADTERDW
jgi:hypothetical protein